MTNIYDLVNLLRDVRIQYQVEYIDAEETKKRELELLKSGYIPGSKPYAEKEQEIQLNYDIAIVRAKEKAAKKGAEGIESMKEWERTSVRIINTEALSKINALRGIPLTTEELTQILAKHGSSNYWVQKAVGALAEEWGIPVTDLPLDASLDVKLSVLDGFSRQLDLLLEHYSPTTATREAAEARFLHLSDDVLNNSIQIYNNGVQDLSETDAATRSYYKIRAMSGQMSKAVAITNALRNLKKEDAKNQLLYQLAMDNTIKPDVYQIIGISDVISEWKHGKSERYTKAIKLMDNIKTTQDVEKIKEKLRGYINRVETGLESENEFLRHEITKSYKKNSFIGRALEEMSRAEKDTLFGSSAEPEGRKVNTSGGLTKEEIDAITAGE